LKVKTKHSPTHRCVPLVEPTVQ